MEGINPFRLSIRMAERVRFTLLPGTSELLSEDEVELAAALGGRVGGGIESVAPVDTEHADYREVESYAETCGSLDLEGRELLPRVERVTALKESQHINL